MEIAGSHPGSHNKKDQWHAGLFGFRRVVFLSVGQDLAVILDAALFQFQPELTFSRLQDETYL